MEILIKVKIKFWKLMSMNQQKIIGFYMKNKISLLQEQNLERR